MQIKACQNIISILVMSLLLVGVLIACSNANDEDPNNENQQIEENNDSINENNAESNDHNSNDNQLEITDNQEQEQEDRVEHGPDEQLNEPDEQNVEHDSREANNTPDNSTNATNDNTSTDSNTTTPLPPEPSDQPSEEPANNPDANASDDRPKLRSPVDSSDDPRALRIGTLNLEDRNQTRFRESFTQRFEWDHPNVDVEFTSISTEMISYFRPPTIDTVAEYRKMLTGDNPPDVLFLGYNDYLALAEEGLLVALNPFLVESELSLDDFEPIVADGLVNPQDGQTYGLSPYFFAKAIIYNKDLFDEMNVPYPHDGMTWEEMFALAKRMTVHDEERDIYGFMFDLNNFRPPLISDLWTRYIPGLGVQVYDLESEKMVVNNDQWASALSTIKDLYDAGVIPKDQSEGEKYTRGNKFLSNVIAMGVVNYRDLHTLPSTPRWDVVSMPVHPEAPHVGAGTVMEPVIAINANGRNQLDAWRLIESIHSPEWASDSDENNYISRLSSRKDHAINLSDQDYNKEAFYRLRPGEGYDNEPISPHEFSYQTINMKYVHMLSLGEIFSNELTIEEALEDWEYRGNTIIFID